MKTLRDTLIKIVFPPFSSRWFLRNANGEVVIPLEVVKEKLAKQEFEDSKTIIGLREALAYFERSEGK